MARKYAFKSAVNCRSTGIATESSSRTGAASRTLDTSQMLSALS
jgi:hypothetical protein